MSCLRKGFKANNAREARRYPGVCTPICVIRLRCSTAAEGGVITWGISKGWWCKHCLQSLSCGSKIDNKRQAYCSLLHLSLYAPGITGWTQIGAFVFCIKDCIYSGRREKMMLVWHSFSTWIEGQYMGLRAACQQYYQIAYWSEYYFKASFSFFLTSVYFLLSCMYNFIVIRFVLIKLWTENYYILPAL